MEKGNLQCNLKGFGSLLYSTTFEAHVRINVFVAAWENVSSKNIILMSTAHLLICVICLFKPLSNCRHFYFWEPIFYTVYCWIAVGLKLLLQTAIHCKAPQNALSEDCIPKTKALWRNMKTQHDTAQQNRPFQLLNYRNTMICWHITKWSVFLTE